MWNPDDVVSVECIPEYDPPFVRIMLLNNVGYDIPYSLYQLIQQPLGLPDIIC